MKFRRSIKFNVWARFEAIVIAMLAFTYVFLIVLFPSFYEWMKTYEIAESMAYIKTSWSLGDSDNFGTVVTNIARKNKMYIEVSTPYRISAEASRCLSCRKRSTSRRRLIRTPAYTTTR